MQTRHRLGSASKKTGIRLSENREVNFPITLAPMVGLSHVALRLVLRDYLPRDAVTLWPTEMLNSRRLPHENLQRTPETMRAEDETDLVPQILGNEETSIHASVSCLRDWGASGIDINMGCPVQKALKHNYGVALMGDPDYAQEVVQFAVRASPLPVSVKFRAVDEGDQQKTQEDLLKKFVFGIQSAGASWVTLHPRTPHQKRRGQADWSQIAELKKELDIPLIGNGDIQTSEDVHRMLEQTGCNMVMAGRALAARPWMLWQLGEDWGFQNPLEKVGRAPRSSEEEGHEYGLVLRKLLHRMQVYFGDDLALRKFRFYIRTTAVWLPFGHALSAMSTKAKNPEEMKMVIEDFFSNEVLMSEKTELRQ